MGLEISGNTKSIRWLENMLVTLLRLNLSPVDISKNGGTPDCSSRVYSVPGMTGCLKIRVWDDDRDGRDSTVKVATAQGDELVELLRKPKSICVGNEFHPPCELKVKSQCGEWYWSKPECKRYRTAKEDTVD